MAGRTDSAGAPQPAGWLHRQTLGNGTLVAMLGLATTWQLASLFFPPFLFPGIDAIARRLVDVFGEPGNLIDALATALRILVGLAGAFVAGAGLAVLMMRSRGFGRHAYPVLNFNQGIPALSWVVISIIWFKPIEFRILFIMVMTTLPAFTFQVLDALRAISKDLTEMALVFRPTRAALFRTLIWPEILPQILTAWKVNLGNASRVVVVAELVGATDGVGYQLMQSQQTFDMAGAIAWTLALVAFVLGSQRVITLVEDHVLRWRPKTERAL